MNSVKGSGVLLRWMNGNLRLCIVRIVVKRMKLSKDDIIYICWLPLIVSAMLIGAILMWTAWALYFLFGGLVWLWGHIREIDFGFDYDIRSKK